MSDLVERLRDHGHMTQRDGLTAMFGTASEAATRIVLLQDALRGLCGNAETVMRYLEEDGPKVVPHLVDSDDNPGQRTRDNIADALILLGY